MTEELDTYTSTDQPETCPKCGARTEAEDLAHGQGLFKCRACDYRYVVDYEDQKFLVSVLLEKAFCDEDGDIVDASHYDTVHGEVLSNEAEARAYIAKLNLSGLRHIGRVETHDTGGGIVNDHIVLKDGRVLVVSEDDIALYESEDAALTGRPSGVLIGWSG